MPLGHCLTQMVSNTKSSPLGGSGTPPGMPSTMQVAEPGLGSHPGLRLLSTDPGAGASRGMSHGMETLEQIGTHAPSRSRDRF